MTYTERIGSTYTLYGSYEGTGPLKNIFSPPHHKYDIKFGFEYEDSKIKLIAGACHSGMLNAIYTLHDKKPIRYISVLPAQTQKVAKAEKYWDKLFGPESPYRSLFKNLEFIEFNGRRIAFIIDVDKDTSTQLLVNLSIAARWPLESDTFMQIMEDFGDHSICDLLILSGTIYYSGRKYSTVNISMGHHAINNVVCPRRLYDANPLLDPTLTVGNRSGYIPCNSIWGSTFKSCMYKSRVNGVKKYKGMFTPCLSTLSIISQHSHDLTVAEIKAFLDTKFEQFYSEKTNA
jgi:hypothetical protein